MSESKYEKVWVQNIKGMLRGIQFTPEMKAACLREFEAYISEAEQRAKDVSVPETQNVTRLQQDVIDLVIAAREFWDIHNDMEPESKALDNALEKFASRVPFEDEATSTVLAEAEERKNEAWDGWSFALGDYVCKKSGSWWAGRVAGFYTTEQTPRGYAVQLDKPFGPVQIYPESALERFIPSEPHDAEGREKPRRGDPSIFDDAEGRN